MYSVTLQTMFSLYLDRGVYFQIVSSITKLHLSNEKNLGRLGYVGILPSFVEIMIKHINHEIKDPY